MPDRYDFHAQRLGGSATEAQAQQSATPTGTVFGKQLTPEINEMLESEEVKGGPLLPPFMASGGLAVGRAIMNPGSLVSRAVATSKAAASTAAPVAKYEATRIALEKMGVPSVLAVPAAIAVSGYRRGGRAVGAQSARPQAVQPVNRPANATGTQWGHVDPASVLPPPAARVSPAASTPAVPASPAAPSAPQSVPTSPAGPKWSPQRIRNEVGLAERRGGLKLSEAQREQADRLVAQGQAPAEAVKAVGGSTAPTPPAAPAPAASVAPKARLNAAETQVFQRLLAAGKTPQEAMRAIEQQRAFAQQFGTPSVADVRKAVADRNATGRWQKDSWQKK